MVRFAIAMAVTMIVTASYGADCLKSPEAVHAVSDANARYSHFMKGHRGQKCWYPEGEKFEHADRSEKTKQPKVRVAVKVAPVAPPDPAPNLTAPTTRSIVPVKPVATVKVANPIAAAHAAFPAVSVQDRINKDEPLTFEERVMFDGLQILGWHLWSTRSADRLTEARQRLSQIRQVTQ